MRPKTAPIPVPSTDVLDVLKDSFKDEKGRVDIELFQFYCMWVHKGFNASHAYKELHPDATDGSCRVLGSRWLARVNRELILEAYNLGPTRYFTQLDEGLNAKKQSITGELHPDHKTRRDYHKALGEVLGIEGRATNPVNVQVNFNQHVQSEKEAFDL